MHTQNIILAPKQSWPELPWILPGILDELLGDVARLLILREHALLAKLLHLVRGHLEHVLPDLTISGRDASVGAVPRRIVPRHAPVLAHLDLRGRFGVGLEVRGGVEVKAPGQGRFFQFVQLLDLLNTPLIDVAKTF